jgi:2-phosphoglycerate kinase
MIVTIGHEGTHRERIEQREEHTYRGPTRYLAAFERIRAIQRGIEERAGGANWKSLDSHLEQDSLGRTEQWLTTAWYQRR